MKITAAVLVELGKPLEIVELECPALKPGQVLVEIALSGVCHTQILETRGLKGADPFLPHCMGHEGVGIVRETSDGVKRVKQGDRVLLSWIKGSGCDVPGTVYSFAGRSAGAKAVNAGGVTTFSNFSIVSENRLTVLSEKTPCKPAAFIGCAGATGLGVVWNTLAVTPGSSIGIFGCGGIGLLAIAGARIAGCAKVVAVDVNDSKLELAQQFGATHIINPTRSDLSGELKKIATRGLDFSVEASGKTAVMLQALEAVRQQGGIAAVVGNAAAGEMITLDPRLLNAGKQLRGTWGGDTQPERDFPRYLELLGNGRLDLEPLTCAEFSLEQVNLGLDRLEHGEVARPLLMINRSLCW